MSTKEIEKTKEKLKTELNNRIKKAMHTQKLSTTDLASEISKTSMSVFNKLNGRTSWNYEELAIIQKELSINLVV
jgi:ribosome-binding protein aMBF1 (putative translation factor)